MHLHLGKNNDPGPVLKHITEEDWDKLAEQSKGERWLAFGGDNATVWLRLAIRGGRTVATGMLIGTGEPLSVAELRGIPLGRLLEIAAAHGDDAMRVALPPAQLDRAPVSALPKVTRKHPGRRGVSDEDLQEVAHVWTVARIKHPRSPMKATAKMTNRSVAQTRRLVRRAEASGMVNE